MRSVAFVPKKSQVVTAPARYRPPVHPGTNEIMMMVEDDQGIFVNFMYLHHANQRISRLETKLARLEAELQTQKDINETREHLEIAVMRRLLEAEKAANETKPKLKLIAKS